MPTAKISPGNAYPIDRNELSIFKILFLFIRTEKLISRAIIEHKTAAMRARVIVLVAASKNLSSKKDGL